MPDADLVRPCRQLRRVVPSLWAAFALAGCVSADARVENLRVASEPDLPSETETLDLSATEAAYARDTARIVFKRLDGERTERFLAADPDRGYPLCLRAGRSYVLLVFQRRIFEAAISQVADDVAILRSDADTAVCRARTDWVASG